MPAPTAYTEDDLARFALLQLGDLGPALGWTPEDPRVQLAARRAFGRADLAPGAALALAEVDELEAQAELAVWERVVAATAGHHAFGVEGMTFNREQVHAQARGMVAEAERCLAAMGKGPNVLVVAAVVRADDPYVYLPPELRTVS